VIGAIAGDLIGSRFEGSGLKDYDFPLLGPGTRFTDDTVVTVAIATAILEDLPYREAVAALCRRYPHAGYGQMFAQWFRQPEPRPYGSWGNGAAMRVSPIGFAARSEAEALEQARRSAVISHDHPEAVKAAQAVALGIHLGRSGADKAAIREALSTRFGYDLERSVAAIRPGYGFDVSCLGSVPESICCFLDADDFEGAARNAVSLGGDADTMACIAGALAQGYGYPIPSAILQGVRQRLPAELLDVVDRFSGAFGLESGA